MSMSIFWRAAAVQALAVSALFALLLALPIPTEFFRTQGWLVGPLAWLLCSLVTDGVLRLGLRSALAAAVLSGLVAAATSALLSHSAGMVVGVVAFGGACARLARSAAPTNGANRPEPSPSTP